MGARRTLVLSWLRRFIGNIGIEPLLLLNEVGHAFRDTFKGELIREHVCADLGYAATICANLSAHKHASAAVGHRWADLNAVAKVPGVLIGLLSAFLMATWSDRFARRPALLAPAISDMVYSLFLLSYMFIPSLPTWPLVYLEPLIYMFGSTNVMKTSALAYIADTCEVDMRATRYAILQGVLLIGWSNAQLVVSAVVRAFGRDSFAYCFGVSLVAAYLEVLYITFYVRETRPQTESTTERPSLLNKVKSVLSVQNLRDWWRILARPRWRLWLLFFLTGLRHLESGQWSIMQPFLESPPFNWPLSQYMFMLVIASYGWMSVYLVLLPLQRAYLNVEDSMLAAIGAGFMSVSRACFALAFGTHRYLFVVGFILAGGTAFMGPATRGMMSAAVDDEEQAKLFALDSILLEPISLVNGFLYAWMWRLGVRIGWNALPFALPAAVMAVAVAAYLVMYADDVRRRGKQSEKELEKAV